MRPKIGIVGTGRTVGIAHYHALGLLQDGRAEIAAVFNPDAQRAAAFLAEHGLENATVCTSYEQLLDCVDAVDICSPNATHVDYTLAAIGAEKAVLVEKPLAPSAAESRLALHAMRELTNGRAMPFNMVGFVYRYAHLFQELRRLVQDEIGRVYTFSASMGGRRLANYNLPLEWRMQKRHSGSGALGDFGSHLVDLASFAAGLSFEQVWGMASTVIPERPANPEGQTLVENDDQAVFTARAADGALASFTVSRVGMDDLMVLIAGEGGLARASLGSPEKILFLPARSGVYSAEYQEIRPAAQPPFEGWFAGQMRAFVDGLTGREVDAPDLQQGHYVECVLEAAEKASAMQAVRVVL